MNDQAAPWMRRLLLALLLAALLVLCYLVVRPFVVAVVWAALLAYLTWPLHRRLRALLRGRTTASALAMTILLAGAFLLPVLWMAVLLEDEVTAAYQRVVSYLAAGPPVLPDTIRRIPWVALSCRTG